MFSDVAVPFWVFDQLSPLGLLSVLHELFQCSYSHYFQQYFSVLKQIDKRLQQLENNMVTTIIEQKTSNTDSKCQSANSEQKSTSEKFNTHENARDRQSTLEHIKVLISFA
jgi:hypothetical protein